MSNKIIDCFIFYNELELLTYRLNILYNVVDYFIIVESTHTFTGKEKKLFYNDNKFLFENFSDKIIHIIVNNLPYKYPDINLNNNEQWKNEAFQRNAISFGINHITNLNDNDVIIISDLDEIPDPNTLENIKNDIIKVDINILEMDFYYYNLNSTFTDKWPLCKIMSYNRYKDLNISCENIRQLKVPVIQKGGWHLSYFGDANFIKNKIISFSHQEYNNDYYTDLSKIEYKINNSIDLFDRNIRIQQIEIKDNPYLPVEYDKYLTKYYK